jgi:hypothetical protein
MGRMDCGMLMEGIRENKKSNKSAHVVPVTERISNSKGEASWKILKEFS